MSDLIDREDVLKVLERVERIHPYKDSGDRDSYSPYAEAWSDCVCLIEQHLQNVPNGTPEIIRCIECKFYTSMRRDLKNGICAIHNTNFGDDGFCSDAERIGDR